MLRITRRDFLKYCSVAAGALGLSASTLMKLDQAMAGKTDPTVVWIAGSACTGCTMSFLNTAFYTNAHDMLFNRINLTYHDTLMATAGAFVNGVQHGGDSLAAARAPSAAVGRNPPRAPLWPKEESDDEALPGIRACPSPVLVCDYGPGSR